MMEVCYGNEAVLFPVLIFIQFQGRKRLANIVYQLGGENRPVQLTEVQDRYQQVYGKPLNREVSSGLMASVWCSGSDVGACSGGQELLPARVHIESAAHTLPQGVRD